MNRKKYRAILRENGLRYGGIAISLLGLLLLFCFGWDKWFGYIILVVGLALVGLDSRKYYKYLEIITETGELAVDGIAAKAGEDVEVTKKMLEEMFKKGLLKGWIDEEKLELRLKEWPGAGDDDKDEDNPFSFRPRIRYTHAKDIICPNCGARIHTKAKRSVKCDYCGKKIDNPAN